MPVPANVKACWDTLYTLCERKAKDERIDTRPTVCAGVIWHAVVRAVVEAEVDHRQPPAHGLHRKSTLEGHLARVKARFKAAPRAGEVEGLLVEGLDFTFDFAAEANSFSTHDWSHRDTQQLWQQAKEVQEYQLQVLRTQLDIDILTHIYAPLLALGVDRTTLTLLGLNVDQRSGTQSTNRLSEEELFRRAREGQHGRGGEGTMREMGRRREGGMPLGRMGFRQRLRYAGAY
ncbi:hypothetical protein JCM6882_001306 [Rhodosporidiobolus microsporus]